MNYSFPFFFFDIVSRIIPGAFTVAIWPMVLGRSPMEWLDSLPKDSGGWKSVVVPFLLACLCYAIGVLYEVFDYLPPMKVLILKSEDSLFASVWAEQSRKYGMLPKTLKEITVGRSGDEMRFFRFVLWEELLLNLGVDPNKSTIFAHCHRFQAEHKMLLHFIYPCLLLAGLSLWYRHPYRGIAELCAVPFFFALSLSRNRRRWLQVVSFCLHLELVEKCVVCCFGPFAAGMGGIPQPATPNPDPLGNL
jgi:hypothetical protein